ncbi:unnamed protein product [Rhizoctonia solani]|uniref:Structure-specific endonuclease subunit SLX4 n=1 Tax=Rhizoctonia solani TaxID=456999 RepID=A0A8H3CK04_9AGAM|nr:unnamed protein product [Rhizoctonia solani]
MSSSLGLVDSEPERQERLAKLRLARKQSQKEKDLKEAVDQAHTSQGTTLTQASAPPASGSTASIVSPGAPPLEEGQHPVRLAKTSSLPVRKPAPPPWLASTTTSTPVDPPKNDASPSRHFALKSSSQHSPVKQLDLNSFAFQKRTVGHSASYSTSSRSGSGSKNKDKESSAVESCSDVPKPPTSSTKASLSPGVFILGATKECPDTQVSFTSDQIKSLRSCVVCEHAWTTRKLPKHKWSHITSCARKGGCDPDALYMKLIAAVVDASDVKATKSSKGKRKEKEPEKEQIGPQYLLAQTVQERAPPKKRDRRVEPGPSTLQPVGDVHKAILERGATLLGVGPVVDVESQSDEIPEVPTDDRVTEKEEAEEEEPSIPATQAFAPSKIGGRSRLLGSTLATLNVDSRSGLFYADLPCTVLPTSTTRPFSTFESSPPSNFPDPPVFSTTPRSARSTSSGNSSIISINSSSDSESNPPGLYTLDNCVRSPIHSDSSASVIILDSTHSYISQKELASPSSPVDSCASFRPASRRQSFGEEWDSQEGVYIWEEHDSSRPSSPTDLLAEHIHGLSLRENDAVVKGGPRGRSRSPRPLSKPRNRSRSSSRPSKKRSKSPAKRKSKSSRPGDRSRSSRRTGSKPASRRVKAKGRLKSKSRSRSRSKSRLPSPKPRKKRIARQGRVYAPEHDEDDVGNDVDSKLLDLILQHKELHLRILRYEPIKFEDILNMAIENGVPKSGLHIKLKSFLDSQLQLEQFAYAGMKLEIWLLGIPATIVMSLNIVSLQLKGIGSLGCPTTTTVACFAIMRVANENASTGSVNTIVAAAPGAPSK